MSTRINPLTGRAYPTQQVAGGASITAKVGSQVNAITAGGAVTVRTPASPAEGASFAVNDQSANAAANPITVAGTAGALIDGAASLVLASNGAYASFVYDTGQWRRIVARRLVDTKPDVQLEFAVDVAVPPATPTTPGTMSAADKAKLDGIQKQGPTTAVAALAIDWALSGTYSKTLGAGASAFTFANDVDGKQITIGVTGGATSTLTWPAGVKWAGGAAPTQTQSGTDVYTFVRIGATIYGSAVQDLH